MICPSYLKLFASHSIHLELLTASSYFNSKGCIKETVLIPSRPAVSINFHTTHVTRCIYFSTYGSRTRQQVCRKNNTFCYVATLTIEEGVASWLTILGAAVPNDVTRPHHESHLCVWKHDPWVHSPIRSYKSSVISLHVSNFYDNQKPGQHLQSC